MARVSSSGHCKEAKSIKENTASTRSTVTERSAGQMAASMLDNGPTENSMDMEPTQTLKERQSRENGRTARKLNEFLIRQ